MEAYPENFPLDDTPTAKKLFEVHAWGRDVIDLRSVVAQNQNETSFKNVWRTQRFSYIKIFLHCLPLKWLIIVLLPSTLMYIEEAGIFLLTLGDILRYLGLRLLMSTCSGWKRGDFWSVTPFDQEANLYPYRFGRFMSERCFNAITHELRFTNTNNPHPMLISFGKLSRW